MPRIYRWLISFCLVVGMPALQATEHAFKVGVQIGVVVPTSPDLKLTTGSPSGAVGFHLDLPMTDFLAIRPRLDAQFFGQGQQHSQDTTLDQTLKTRVSTLGIGADALVPLVGLSKSMRVGISIQELRWQVASVNTVRILTGGTSEVSGTSTWWRFAWGPVVAFQVNDQLEIEGRLSLSRYGQENQPANTAAIGVLWHF